MVLVAAVVVKVKKIRNGIHYCQQRKPNQCGRKSAYRSTTLMEPMTQALTLRSKYFSLFGVRSYDIAIIGLV
jgi:hypothetical protein